MTDRLAQLLHDEADTLEVPPAPSRDVLAMGRARRTRRRVTTGVAVLAALAVVGTGLGVALGDDDEQATDPAGTSGRTADVGAVFAIGTDVYLEGGRVRASIDDGAVKSIFYTSAGVVVRHGDNPYSDGGGPQRFSLVTPDGEVEPLSVETEEAAHGTDPTQPLLAWAESVDGEVQVVVHDVAADRELARVTVPGASEGFLPVSVDGDVVSLQAGEQGYLVDWRTGEVSPDDGAFDHGGVTGGRATVGYGETTTVVDTTTGEELLRVESEQYAFLDLSPDGRFAKLFVEYDTEPPADATTDVYEVETGQRVEVPGAAWDWGWTATGDLLAVDEQGRVTTCEARTGDCATETRDLRVAPNGLEGPPVETCETSADGTMCTTEPEENFDDDLVLGGVRNES